MSTELSNSIARTPTHWTQNSVINVIRRYWWFIAVVMAVALAATFVLTKQQTAAYSSSAQVILRTNETLALFPLSASGPLELRRSAEVEQLYASSTDFISTVRSDTPDGVRVSSRAGTSNLVFTARGESPEAVAEAANLWASTYVVERHKAVIAEQDEDAAFIREQIAELSVIRDEVREELDALEDLIDATTDSDQLSRLLVQKVSLEQTLQSELAPVNQQIFDFRQQLANFELLTRFLSSDEISARLGRAASVPTEPVSPNLTRNLAVGGLLGMALGFALPYLRLSLSDAIDEREDVVAAASLSVLSSIPSFDHETDQTIEVLDHPTSPATEHYQALLTAIEFAAIGEPVRSIFFTSAEPGEGKTTTSINLGALAAQYKNVIVIDADMRRPSMHEITGVPNTAGLSSVLSGKSDLFSARQTFERGDTSFDVLPAGPIVDDPALLLRGPAWKELLDQLFLYDLVVVDGPPVLAVTDALLIGRPADAQVLVVRWGKTKRKTLASASELLGTNGSRTLGAVVNRASMGQSGYQYYETYRSESAEEVVKSSN